MGWSIARFMLTLNSWNQIICANFSRNEEKQTCPEAISSHLPSMRINPTQTNPIYLIQSRMGICCKTNPKHVNELNWHIHSIEDSILSQSNVPFPLGLLVRRKSIID